MKQQFYQQVVKFLHERETMNDEIQATERTGTWRIVLLLPHHHTIGSKWVYRVKYKPDKYVDGYKAQLIAKGYNQQEGVDYLETFFPVQLILQLSKFF